MKTGLVLFVFCHFLTSIQTCCQVFITFSSLITRVDKSKLHKPGFGFIFDIPLQKKLIT